MYQWSMDVFIKVLKNPTRKKQKINTKAKIKIETNKKQWKSMYNKLKCKIYYQKAKSHRIQSQKRILWD